MEASALRGFELALNEHDRRLVANHDSIAKLRDQGAAHDTKIGVITTELRETREDIADMKTQLQRDSEERKRERERDREERTKERSAQEKESADTRKALYVTAATLAGFMLTIVGLIATLLNGG